MDVVVLGSGPTAVFAHSFLSDAGVRARLVGSFEGASIAPVDTPFGPVTLVPVFPPSPAPKFPPSAQSGELLTLGRAGDSAWIETEQRSADSLLNSLTGNRDGTAMALKQYGEAARARPLSEVLRKVSRAYGGAPHGRVGYIDGLSPYYSAMKQAIHNAIPAPSAALEWDPQSRLISTDDGPVTYKRLVYTGTIPSLATALSLPMTEVEHAPASFGLYAADHDLHLNHLVYDLRRGSPLFRVFTPRSRVAVVQYSQVMGEATWASSDTSAALADIFDGGFESLGPVAHLAQAYPVERPSNDGELELDRACAAASIFRFGRNATARYVDLHELPWEELAVWGTA